MHFPYTDAAVLLPAEEFRLRVSGLRQALAATGAGAVLLRDQSTLFWCTGRVFNGYVLVTADRATLLVRRPSVLAGADVAFFHSMKDLRAAVGTLPAGPLALELGVLPWNTAERLRKELGAEAMADISPALRQLRSVKTPYEIDRLRQSGVMQVRNYSAIPSMYRPGMTDLDLQIEIEYHARRLGCLGQFRMAGDDMDLFMGNILTGENADSPSPYDFAMGGRGIHPSLPVGADGTVIRPGIPVMVDLNGNYTGYMTDMTRCYCAGSPEGRAVHAHRTSIAICRELAAMGRPGVEARAMYERALAIATEAGLADNFMGFTSHAGFVGHGIGIDVNEGPVLAPRSRDVLAAGNVIALEPKFVLPGVGAAGIENTYVVRPDGPMECITNMEEEIIPFDE